MEPTKKSSQSRTQLFIRNLFKMDEQYDSKKVISRIEKNLLYANLISSSFQDILDGKLDKKRRRIQLMFALLLLGMLIRFWISCYLYTRDKETMKYYQYWIIDYMETLGLIGRCLNAIYGCNFITMTINRFFFRSWESSGKLEFLTEMLSLKSGQRRKNKSDGLTDDERNKFISLTHKKLIFLNISLMSTVLPCDFFTQSAVESLFIRFHVQFLSQSVPWFLSG